MLRCIAILISFSQEQTGRLRLYTGLVDTINVARMLRELFPESRCGFCASDRDLGHRRLSEGVAPLDRIAMPHLLVRAALRRAWGNSFSFSVPSVLGGRNVSMLYVAHAASCVGQVSLVGVSACGDTNVFVCVCPQCREATNPIVGRKKAVIEHGHVRRASQCVCAGTEAFELVRCDVG